MRRLIAWIYAACLGLQIKTHDQHIADIEQLLMQALAEFHNHRQAETTERWGTQP